MADEFIGSRNSVGLARETVRGAGAAATYWLPWTELSFDEKTTKVDEEEALGVIDYGDASYPTEQYAEGEISGEIRDKSIGLLLYSALGACSSAVAETTAYNHTFTISQTNNHQSLAITFDNPVQDVMFKLAMIDSLNFDFSLGELAKYTANFMSQPATDTTASASHTAENKFVSRHITMKLADNLAGLGAASAISVKNIELSINKNVMRDHVLGTVSPEDIFNQQLKVEGSFELNMTDETYKDLQINNTYKALRIELTNSGVTIGASSNPKIQINLPRVNFFDWEQTRDLGEITTQKINFMALRDLSGGNATISSVVLTNEVTSY